MNKFLLSVAFFLLITVNLIAQVKVSGTVKRSDSGKTVYDATVTILEIGESVSTDRIGYFQFIDVPEGDYTLRIESQGFEDYEQQISVGTQKLELGDLTISYDPTDVNTGIITLSSDELSDDESSTQPSIGLLQASRDVFAQTAAFEFGSYFFRVRGYENKYQDVLFNGVRMNKIDNDRVDFGNWGGLNDITRYPEEVTLGINPSAHAFGDAGGVTSINPRPSNLRKGVSLAYSLTNRSYRQRVLASYNSGLSEKGWAFSFSGARRWAEEGRIEGTLYDAWAYFAAIEKKFNDKHTLVLSGFGAPYRRTSNSPVTQEIYDLRGIDYNAYWGWQDGEKRNERIRRNFEPVFQLVHYWNLNDKTRINTTLSYQFGTNGSTRLDWYNANNPSPIYWRNAPSAFRADDYPDEVVNSVINRWQTDSNWYQLDWQSLYDQNANTNAQGLPAAYVLADDKNDDKIYSFHTDIKTKITDDIDLTIIGNYQKVNSELYRELDDLLGANFAANDDDFHDPGTSGEFDENTPGRQVLEGERFQYNYEFNRDVADLYLRTDFTIDKFDVKLGFKTSYTRANRDGKYRHYLYLDNSFGKSRDYEFWNFGVKGQVTYKINGRNYIQANGAYFTTAPTMQEIFPNARSNDLTIPNLESAKTTATDLSYILRSQRIKARATGFYTKFEDEIESNFAFVARAGNANAFGALVTTGVDKQHIGGEFALDAKLTSTIRGYAVASVGQYTYTDNANQFILSDDASLDDILVGNNVFTTGIDDRGTAYIKDYKVAEGPQKAFSLGFEYRSPKFWWVGVSGNFLADNYVSIANVKRTRDFITDFTLDSEPILVNPDTGLPLTMEEVEPLLRQEKFSDEFLLNFNAGKTFRLGKYYAGISLNVNNVLDNKDYRTGGFEQARLLNYTLATDENLSQTFGNRYWYNQGISYFLNFFLRF